ncbi:hypothetical protein A2Z22_03605, partial [Candidatus Woesebacteria bacterium RBG_16_34_12]
LITKITVSIILFLIAICFASSTAFASELLVNGGFETGDSTGWNLVNSSITNEDAHSGTFSLKLSGQESQAFQEINPPTGANRLTFWVKCASGSSCYIGLGVEFEVEFPPPVDPGIPAACAGGSGGGQILTNEWTKFVFYPDNNCLLKSIRINVTGSETLIDDILLYSSVHNINKSTNYTTIQAAIDDANPGDEIHVDSGTYYENVNVTKQLTLRGIGMPVVDARGSGSAITLSADGITLEGFTAIRADSFPEAGLKVRSKNNTLISNTASNNEDGINLDYLSNNNTLIGNTVNSNNEDGIGLWYSSNNMLIGNNASDNAVGGIGLSSSSNNTLIGNNVSNNSVGICLSSSNNTLIGNNVSNNKYSGISLDHSSNSALIGNNASNDSFGIFMSYSSNNTLIGNTANSNNAVGIYLHSSSNNSMSENTASNSGGGIYLDFSSNNNTLSGNNASDNNYDGISLQSSSNNILIGNNVSNNYYGIYLDSSSNNTIYNNIFNNTNEAQFYGLNINTWNTNRQSGTNIMGGPYLGGNFWGKPDGTGFSQTCEDDNGDGICNESYVLDANNIDYLPLSINFTSTPTMITGTVTNATDGSPIPGALVNLSNSQNNITITDGAYIINSVPIGSYFITTTAAEYAPNITSINVTEGINIKNILLEECRNDFFTDINCGYWGYAYIKYLYDHGVTTGYPDGTFRPENQITRAETATFVVRAMNLTYTGEIPNFPDVQTSHWAYLYIMAAKEAGIISGYPDGTFKPDNLVTRAEISTMITRARGWSFTDVFSDFPDVPPTHWSYPYVMAVKEKGVVGGYPDGTFKPDTQATRAENSVMISKMMLWY